MAQVRTDAQGPDAQVRAGPRGSADRPMSPHLQVWRWHVTMAASILHRGAIIACYVGALILTGFFVALASGEEAFATYKLVLGSPMGLLVMFGLTVAFVFLTLENVRRLFWDFGLGLDIKTAGATAWLVIVSSVVLALAIWAVALSMGAF
jgi:succinate dehydrogenase / fumarate reductase cytochrome b subunit